MKNKIVCFLLCCLLSISPVNADSYQNSNNQTLSLAVVGVGIVALVSLIVGHKDGDQYLHPPQHYNNPTNVYTYKHSSDTKSYVYNKDNDTYEISTETVQQQTVEDQSTYPRGVFSQNSIMRSKPKSLPIYEVDCGIEGNYDYEGKEISKSKVCRPKIAGYQEIPSD